MQLHIFREKNELIEALVEFMIAKINRALDQQGYCNLVLAGGNSPQSVYEKLASPEHRIRIDWSKVFLFFGDERYVSAEHEDYNGGMVFRALVDPLDISESQVFNVDTSLSPEKAAARYMDVILTHFKYGSLNFDLVLLGLGDDVHTASLFPFTDVLSSSEPAVKAVYLKEKMVYRITMTAPLINQAKDVAFLTFGANKATAVRKAIKGARDFNRFPAQLIQPVQGGLHWFIDEAAATGL